MDIQSKILLFLKKKFIKIFNKMKKSLVIRYKYLVKSYYYKKFLNITNNIIKRYKPKFIIIYKHIRKKIVECFTIALKIINKDIKITAIVVILLTLFILYLINNSNTYTTLLFYPDKSNYLVYERREIIKNTNKIERIRNSIDELLVGPMSPYLENIFPKESKLLSLILDDDTLLLNFNKNLIMDKDWETNKSYSVYRLILNCIVHTVCYQFNDIKKVRFFFDGREYRFIGDIGPIDKGVTPDWSVLSK